MLRFTYSAFFGGMSSKAVNVAKEERLILLLIRKRSVWLSITHKFGRIEPKLDVGESGEPTTHDHITRRRITRASKVAAQSGQLGDVERQRPVYGATDAAIRDKMIKQLALGF